MVFSRTNYWLGFTFDFGVSLAMIAGGALALGRPAPVLAALVLGGVAFTFYEYVLHRWLYHVLPTAVRRLHTSHHGEPRRLIGAPVFYSLGVTALTWAVASLVVSGAAAAVFAGALLFGYAYHGAVHALIHARRFRGRGFFARLQRHHLVHHAPGHDGVNYGVTTTFWDRVFATTHRR
jgi:sterol desaturase/sphingolipid hydroxylase (fatty acid hydroxylase superfamily)